jgi:hypothetical protein
MHHERTEAPREGDDPPKLSVAEKEDREDAMVLGLLLNSDQPGLWSVDEVIRAAGDRRIGAADGLLRLERYGLIHRLGDFVFPTRAAVRSEEIRI